MTAPARIAVVGTGLMGHGIAQVFACAGHTTILASNTSVLPITRIMEGLKHRERALGTHW